MDSGLGSDGWLGNQDNLLTYHFDMLDDSERSVVVVENKHKTNKP